MTNPLHSRSWSPYVVGALIGVLSWFAFATADKPLGITTAFEYTAALAIKTVSAGGSASAYLSDPAKTPKIDWEWMLVAGVFIGAFISSKLSGDRDASHGVPATWARRFGPSRPWRFIVAFVSAALMMFGARIAQGCTSGHGISGALQLAVSSWIFVPAFVVAAFVTARAVYGREA